MSTKSLIWEKVEPQGDVEGILVGFYIGGMARVRASEEFKNFIHVDMIDRPNSYYRVGDGGVFRDPQRYCGELAEYAESVGVGMDRVMTWGSSRGATMALAVGMNLGVRCVFAAGPQINAIADISYVKQHGLQGVASPGRAREEARFVNAIYNSVRSKKMDREEFFTALQGLDLASVMLRSNQPLPRIFILIGAQNKADNYGVQQIEAAARSMASPVWVYRFPTRNHAILADYKPRYISWLRSVFDNEPPKINGVEVTAIP